MKIVKTESKTNYWMIIVVFLIIASVDLWIMFGPEYFKIAFLATLFTAVFIHLAWWIKTRSFSSLVSMFTTLFTGLVFLAIILNSQFLIHLFLICSGILWFIYYVLLFTKKIS